jgi:hypothetical protein
MKAVLVGVAAIGMLTAPARADYLSEEEAGYLQSQGGYGTALDSFRAALHSTNDQEQMVWIAKWLTKQIDCVARRATAADVGHRVPELTCGVCVCPDLQGVPWRD